LFSKRWTWASIIGLLAFLWVQVGPGIHTVLTEEELDVLTRAEAESAAMSLAAEHWGIAREDVGEVRLSHVSDNDAVAYLAREKLSKSYEDAWDEVFPNDVYRADLRLAEDRWLRLSLHMLSGRLVGWTWYGGGGEGPSGGTGAVSVTEQRVTNKELLDYLKQWGYEPADWEPTGTATGNGDYVFQSRKAPIGEARLQLLVKPGESIAYRLQLPESFTAYLAGQEERASSLSMVGYLLPQIVLFVLAIAYAAQYRKITSLRRGWFLALVYFGLYACFTMNMIAGFRSRTSSFQPPSTDGTVEALLIVNAIILALTAVLTSLSAVAGDGLWKSMGYNLWPSWRESGFGAKVLRSMKQGYGLGLIILGAQSVIFLGLDGLLGSFTGSDASQSTYNMTYPWLLPVLAWCAGISEELIYRFFGIALFRWWLISIARTLTRREPNGRTKAILTFVAMLPPSLFWGFGHVGYPIYPVQSRVIELAIIGVLIGWFLLRFGLMAVIFAHVTLDAILMSVQLIFDGLPYDPVSGLVSMAMPGLVGVAIWWLHGVFSRRRAN